jgi:hypothetical protein
MGVATQRETEWIVSEGGWKLYARVHRPVQSGGTLPAVLLVPGLGHSGRQLEKWVGPIHPGELASLGCVVLALDLSGRGYSWGNEDYGGPDHQGDVRAALRYLVRRADVHSDRIGVVSLSLGCAATAGALASGNRPNVAWWIDWEGPSDREVITAGGRKLLPAQGHALGDEAYWRTREAVRFVGDTGVPYIRYQSESDHAQPGEYRHAERMIAAAGHGNLPWFQINDHPLDEVPWAARWLPSGTDAANQWLVNRIRALHRI